MTMTPLTIKKNPARPEKSASQRSTADCSSAGCSHNDRMRRTNHGEVILLKTLIDWLIEQRNIESLQPKHGLYFDIKEMSYVLLAFSF